MILNFQMNSEFLKKSIEIMKTLPTTSKIPTKWNVIKSYKFCTKFLNNFIPQDYKHKMYRKYKYICKFTDIHIYILVSMRIHVSYYATDKEEGASTSDDCVQQNWQHQFLTHDYIWNNKCVQETANTCARTRTYKHIYTCI